MEEECRITPHKKITEMLKSEEGLERGREKRRDKREFADRVVSKAPYLNRKM